MSHIELSAGQLKKTNPEISCVIYTVERARDQEKYSLDVSFLYLSEEERELTCFPRFPAFLEKRSRQKISGYQMIFNAPALFYAEL